MDRPERPLYLDRRLLVRTAGVIAAAWLLSLGAVLIWSVRDDAKKADAIVVMGAAQYRGKPSPVLRTRLDHAMALWKRGLAPRMVLTGGIGDGDSVSEASVSRAYVRNLGVPDTAMLLENDGRTSSESLRAAADLLQARGLHTVVLVSDPFHLLRLEILARRYGLDPHTSPAAPAPSARWSLHRWGTLLGESIKAPLAIVLDW